MREALLDKLKVAVEATLSAEERSQQMDEMLTEEEKRQDALRSQLKILSDVLFRKDEEKQKAKVEEKKTEAEINVRGFYLYFRVHNQEVVHTF